MTTDAPPVVAKKKLIEVALPLDADQQGVEAREVDPARAPQHAAPLVGAAAAGSGAGRDLRADGGRPVRQPRPVPHRACPGAGAPAALPHHRAARAVGEHDERGRAGAGARGNLAVLASRLRGERRPPPREGAVRPPRAPGIPRPVRRRRLAAAGGAAAGAGGARVRPEPRRRVDQQGDDRDPAEVRGQDAGEPEGTGRRPPDGPDLARRAGSR